MDANAATIDQIVKYVRRNFNTIKSLLLRPDGTKVIIKKLKEECPHGELADLLAPVIIQRAQGVIQESALRRNLGIVLDSSPAQTEEARAQKVKPVPPQNKIGAYVPQSLVSFESDDTNAEAYRLYTQYSQKFDVGKSIALTRRDLMAAGVDMHPARPRPFRLPPSAPPKPEPKEAPSLFSDDEMRYMSPLVPFKNAARKPVPPGFYILVGEIGHERYGVTIGDERWMEEDLSGRRLATGMIHDLRKPFTLFHSEAEHGYGPALYDAALIFSTQRGRWTVPASLSEYLCDDPVRMATSAAAQAVWKHYYEGRPDVDKRDVSEILPEGLFEDKPWMHMAYRLKGRLEDIAPVWSDQMVMTGSEK